MDDLKLETTPMLGVNSHLQTGAECIMMDCSVIAPVGGTPQLTLQSLHPNKQHFGKIRKKKSLFSCQMLSFINTHFYGCHFFLVSHRLDRLTQIPSPGFF